MPKKRKKREKSTITPEEGSILNEIKEMVKNAWILDDYTKVRCVGQCRVKVKDGTFLISFVSS